MLITGNEDLRVQKTIEIIKKIFKEMVLEYDYEKIKVSELCERAKISKKTFYRYYDSIDSLLKEIQQEMSSAYIERIKNYKLPEELVKVNEEFFLFSSEQDSAYEKITIHSSYNYIRDQMIKTVNNATWSQSPWFSSLDNNVQNVIISFVKNSTLSIYKQWVLDGKKIPLENIIKISTSLLCGAIENFKKVFKISDSL